MSRNRNRQYHSADVAHSAAPQPAQQAAPFTFSRPVRVDRTKFEISDLKVFALAPQMAQDEATAQAAIPQLIDMLERVVVGGLSGRPATEFWPLVQEVGRQLNGTGNPKN